MATDRQSTGLTERQIRDAKPGVKTRVLWDHRVKGLGVRITPAGAKSYILNYRVAGRERRATLGRPSEISLRAAREQAGRELAAIRAGGPDPLLRRRGERDAPTVSDGLDRFFDEYVPQRMAKRRMSERTQSDYAKQAKRTIRPALGSLKIAHVTKEDVERAVKPRAPVQRNRTLALASRLFNLFETWGYRPQNTNPCKGIERVKEEPRDRVLRPSELEAFGAALSRSDDTYPIAAIRFLLLTGWRNGEALGLKWEHVDFENGEIVLPETKAGRQVRKVAALAMRLLSNVPRINGNPYVFAGSRSVAIGYKRLRGRFAGLCREAGIEDCRLHDIRRTTFTSAAASGLSALLIRDLMNVKGLAMANRYVRRAGAELQEAHDASAARMVAMIDREREGVVATERGDSPEGEVAAARDVTPDEAVANCQAALMRGEAPSSAVIEALLEIAKAGLDRPSQER